jgi:PAS domain S-box-containing protein
MSNIRVLILEDVPLDAELSERELKKEGLNFSFHRVETREDFLNELETFKPDLILADHSLPHFDGLSALKIAKNKTPHIPFIFVSGKIGEDYAVEMLKEGATDYVLKNNLTKLSHAVLRALKESEEQKNRAIAEKSLLESEKKYRTLFEKSKNPIFVCKKDGNFIDCNEAGLIFLEKHRKDLIGHNIKNWVESTDFIDLFSGKNDNAELVFVIGGNEKIMDVSITLVELDGGKSYFLQGKDVTKQRKAEKSLQAQSEEYKAIFENTGTLSLIFERDTTISMVNTEFENFSGYSNKELHFRKKWLDFVASDDLERMEGYHRMQRINPRAIPKNYEVTLKNRNGIYKDFFATSELIPGTEKGIISFMDITDRKNAENKIKKSLKEKELLLREIHHRVKNNMQIISTLLTLQSAQINDQKLIQLYRESQDRIQAMALIHEKLYQSKDISQINLREYVESMVSDLLYSYERDSRIIEADLDVEDILMNIDTAVPCGLIINELVSNSLKYAFPDDHGTVKIYLRRLNDEGYYLKVSDDGIGLPEDFDTEKIEKIDTLGLQIVNNLVNQIEGVLRISRPSTFEIKFKELKYKERV